MKVVMLFSAVATFLCVGALAVVIVDKPAPPNYGPPQPVYDAVSSITSYNYFGPGIHLDSRGRSVVIKEIDLNTKSIK